MGAEDATYPSSITVGHSGAAWTSPTVSGPAGQNASTLGSPSQLSKAMNVWPLFHLITSPLLFQGPLYIICAAGGGVCVQPYTSILPQVNNYVAAVKSKPVLITVTCPWTWHFTIRRQKGMGLNRWYLLDMCKNNFIKGLSMTWRGCSMKNAHMIGQRKSESSLTPSVSQ